MMSSIISSLKSFVSPTKLPFLNGDNQIVLPDNMNRGVKRKAAPDGIGADNYIITEPSSSAKQRRVRSRVSIEVPITKRHSRLMGKKIAPELGSSPSNSSEQSKAPVQQSIRNPAETEKCLTSKVLVADMGVPELLQNRNNTCAEPNSDASETSADNDANHMIENTAEKSQSVDIPTNTEVEIEKLLKHRRLSNGKVELLVKWVDEPEEDASFEPEEEIQQGAAETLYKYWTAQGGRTKALFYKDRDAPLEAYHVFRILGHKKKKGGFQLEVQWVGYPATPGNKSYEPEAKLKRICPDLLEEYWESQGGREKHLARPGRAKRAY
ncbi:hypothetical protein PG987_013850 [Apiospora arundinis]